MFERGRERQPGFGEPDALIFGSDAAHQRLGLAIAAGRWGIERDRIMRLYGVQAHEHVLVTQD
jgi:hypothetical protein